MALHPPPLSLLAEVSTYLSLKAPGHLTHSQLLATLLIHSSWLPYSFTYTLKANVLYFCATVFVCKKAKKEVIQMYCIQKVPKYIKNLLTDQPMY